MFRLPVEFADEAIAHIWKITDFVAVASGSYRVARSFTVRIEARCRRIGNAPRGGKSRDVIVPGLRTVPFERSALICYVVRDDRITITNIFHGGQDFETILRDRGNPPKAI